MALPLSQKSKNEMHATARIIQYVLLALLEFNLSL